MTAAGPLAHRPAPILAIPPASILTHPPILSALLTHLDFPSTHHLRHTNQHFHAHIPPPTHASLLLAETAPFALAARLFACAGCTRLRPADAFSPKMLKKKKRAGKLKAYNRFCVECGRRELPGKYRYLQGARWEEGGVPMARCAGCGCVARGPEYRGTTLCEGCYMREVERARVSDEEVLARIQMINSGETGRVWLVRRVRCRSEQERARERGREYWTAGGEGEEESVSVGAGAGEEPGA